MDRTPIEIWGHIWARACTDGGATGRSLSLVSRRVRETSKDYRLQSISIDGHRQAIQFALMLDCTPMKERRIIDLSVRFDEEATQRTDPDEWTYRRVYQRMNRSQKVSEAIMNLNPIFKYYRVHHDPSSTHEGHTEMENQRSRGAWRNEQYKKELIRAVDHILLHLSYPSPLHTLTLRAGRGNYGGRTIPWVGWYFYATTLDSWIIDGPMHHYTFLGMRFNTEGWHSTIRYLDITGLYYDTTKHDIISHITRFAPSLEYLRFKITTAMAENLPPSQWLFDDALGSISGYVSLPNTIKMVFALQLEVKGCDEGSPFQIEYARLAESFKNLGEHDHRVKVLESDNALSLYQLVDRLQC